jgi:protein required for attachment to host cells
MTERVAYFLKNAIEQNSKITWLVIAQRTGAKFFQNLGPGRNFKLVQELSFPKGRAQNREIDTDRSGMIASKQNPEQHPFDPEEKAHQHLGEVFSKQIADLLEKERGRSTFDQVVLIAEPKFLGMIKAQLSQSTLKTLLATIGKELDERQENHLLERALDLLREAQAA